MLLRRVTGRDRAAVLARPEAALDAAALDALEALLARRLAGEPIAYVLGTREFWSLELAVGPGALVPRPDTETLVERALERLPGDPAALVLEAGTGSGAIAVALARECPNPVVATELHAAALGVAAANVARHAPGGRVRLVRADWLAPFAEQMTW